MTVIVFSLVRACFVRPRHFPEGNSTIPFRKRMTNVILRSENVSGVIFMGMFNIFNVIARSMIFGVSS